MRKVHPRSLKPERGWAPSMPKVRGLHLTHKVRANLEQNKKIVNLQLVKRNVNFPKLYLVALHCALQSTTSESYKAIQWIFRVVSDPHQGPNQGLHL